MSTNYGFEPTLDGLNNIDADSTTTTNIVCDTIQINNSGTAPTVSALSNDTNIATTAWVTNHASATYVTLAGASQTISSEKTFTNANTYITGNTVTNDIVSALPTSNINIGSALTTGDINLGSSAVATGVALNWGGASNSGNLSFQGGSFTLTSSGIYTQRSGPTFDMTIADTQTSGVLNIAGNASRTGAINIGTGTTTAKNITIGTGSGGTTLLRGASATVTIGNSGTLTLSSATGGTVNLGTAMTSGSINIGASSVTNNILGLTYINGSGTQNTGIGNTTGIVDIKGSNMLLNTTGVVTTNIGNILSTTYLNGAIFFQGLAAATFNTDIYIQQSTYPSINDSQLGYTLTVAGTAGNTTTNVWKTLNQIDVPSKGVWLFVGLYQLDIAAGQPGDIEQLRFGLSSVAPVSFTRVSNIEYYRETDDSVGLNDLRDRLQVSGVFTTTASATYYFSARLRYTGFIASDIQTKGDSTLTRIG